MLRGCVFVIASLVLIATPGQDMILVMSRSIAQGAAAGVVTAGGVSVGLVGHTVLATLGLGAILRTSEWLFVALKLVGAAYLIYLGIGLLRTRQSSLPIGSQAARESRQALCRRRGFQPVQSQDRDLLLCLPAAIRLAVGAESDAHRIRAGARLRGPDVRRQGAGRHLRRDTFVVAAFAARRPHLGLSFLGCNPGGPRRQARIRAALTEGRA